MKLKQKVDLVTSLFLIFAGMITLILPVIDVINVKYIFISILSFYAVINLFQFIITYKSKDYEALFTVFASLITTIVAFQIDLALKPWNLAIVLFIWVIMMSLIKLKKCDYYHDRCNTVWAVRVVTLLLFIATGILCTINLYYGESVQVLVLGFFFYIHGILELIDPISVYLNEKQLVN